MSPSLLVPLQKQAEKIARRDQDLSQSLIAMSYQNYLNTLQNRKKELTIAELTNFMKNRSKEIKSGRRHYFGNGGSHSRKDVFNKFNYYNGEGEIHPIDYFDENGNSEDPFNGKGAITAATSVRNLAQTHKGAMIKKRPY
jgi:hypothetical protein